MAKIKYKDTKPELVVRHFLHSKGLRYRKHYDVTGKPDVVFVKDRIAIFVHGCFWHQHGCKYTTQPKTNTAFWESKLESNVKRDKQIISELKKKGWKIVIVWECSLKERKNEALNSIYKKILKMRSSRK